MEVTAAVPVDSRDPDALYADREDMAAARQAAAIWTARLSASAADFEAAWKLSRADYWLGTHGSDSERRRDLESGVEAGRAAATLKPDRPEGYFWMAANMGELAESYGMRQGLKYRKPIREALERARAIDPTYLGGAPDRALGRWYYKVPGLFGGNKEKSLEYLTASLKYQPDSTVGRYFLAETLLALGRKPAARVELQRVLDAPIDPAWVPEDKEWKGKARALLDKTK
jgi:tetratricopeptide (TPR) repeat protein